MEKLPGFVNMAVTPQEREEEDYASPAPEAPAQPIYPYGLCISLCQDELEKLDLEDDCDVGDMLHMHCIARVTSVSKNDTTDGPKMRVELQITDIAAESEDEENAEYSPNKGNIRDKMYSKG